MESFNPAVSVRFRSAAHTESDIRPKCLQTVSCLAYNSSRRHVMGNNHNPELTPQPRILSIDKLTCHIQTTTRTIVRAETV